MLKFHAEHRKPNLKVLEQIGPSRKPALLGVAGNACLARSQHQLTLAAAGAPKHPTASRLRLVFHILYQAFHNKFCSSSSCRATPGHSESRWEPR